MEKEQKKEQEKTFIDICKSIDPYLGTRFDKSPDDPLYKYLIKLEKDYLGLCTFLDAKGYDYDEETLARWALGYDVDQKYIKYWQRYATKKKYKCQSLYYEKNKDKMRTETRIRDAVKRLKMTKENAIIYVEIMDKMKTMRKKNQQNSKEYKEFETKKKELRSGK